MDEYEAFFDEYVEFMKKYKESDDVIGMLDDYVDMMKRYAEAMEALEKIEGEEMSSEEALYYTEGMTRISQKLLEVA